MDHSPISVDNADGQRQTAPEVPTTRPNPFGKKATCARKRRRTSASTSQSSMGEVSSMDDASRDSSENLVASRNKAATSSQDIPAFGQGNGSAQVAQPQILTRDKPYTKVILSLRRAVDEEDDVSVQSTAGASELGNEQGRNCQISQSSNSSNDNLDSAASALHVDQEMTEPPEGTTPVSDLLEIPSPPEAFPFVRPGHELHESVYRLARSITNGRDLDIDNLRLLISWMQSTVDFIQYTGREVLLDSFQLHRKFWAAIPSIVNAIKSYRSRAGEPEQICFAMKEVIALFSRMTAGMANFDHVTLELVLADTSIEQDNAMLFAMEYLYVWLELIQFGKYAVPDNERASILAPLTPADIANTLLDPLSESQCNTAEWLDNLAYDFAAIINTKKTRISEFSSVLCILSEYVHILYIRTIAADLEPAGQKDAAACLRRSGNVWVVMSDAFNTMMDKNPSILTNEMAGILIKALTSMLSVLCQQNRKDTEDMGGFGCIDELIQAYNRRYPQLATELLAKAAPLGWQFDVLLKLIKSGPMHLRVMAVGTLCSSLTDVWGRERDNSNHLSLLFLQHLGRVLEGEFIDYVIGPSCHPEIIIGSADIMSFLVLSGVRGETAIDRLWQSIETSQDQRVADAVTRVISNVVSVLNYDSLIHLCSKFERIPIAEFSQPLQTLWEKVIRETANKSHLQNCPLTLHPYLSALRILREMPTCDHGCVFAYSDLHAVVIQRIRELLAFGLETEVRQELYRICVGDLASKSPTTLGSLWFLTTCIRPTISNELCHLWMTHDIVTKVVEELESAAIVAFQTSSCVVFGAANQARRDLITQIIHHQPKSITDELGRRLWDVLVGPKSTGPPDRGAAWQMLLTVGSNSGFQNLFLQTCFAKYLPSLSPSWFCEGLLNFVKENILLVVNGNTEFNLDDEILVQESGIEHIWRIILFSHDEGIARSATMLLVCSVYLDSDAIARCPISTVQSIHLGLVRRCLKLMREAVGQIQDVTARKRDGDNSAMLVEEDHVLTQSRREFSHALRILLFFLDTYHKKPQYFFADLRSLIPKRAAEIAGERTMLQYQAFDGAGNSGAKSLMIGKQNSLASLLAVLRDESGFASYRAYYKGRRLIPNEKTVCKSLEELNMHEGLILVKKEEPKLDIPAYIKPGSSPIEIEILSRFQELWQYLGMDEELAFEVYIFTLKLPADGRLLERIDCNTASYADLFAPDQPFRSLYAIHVLTQYVKSTQPQCSPSDICSTETEAIHNRAVSKSLDLLCRALDDDSISQNATVRTQRRVCSSLMMALKVLFDGQCQLGDDMVRLLTPTSEADASRGSAAPVVVLAPSTDRLLRILEGAMQSQAEESIQLTANCIALIFRLVTLDQNSWTLFTENPLFQKLLLRLCVLDSSKPLRQFVVGLVEEAVDKDLQDKTNSRSTALYFWNWASASLKEIASLGEASQDLMKLLYSLILKMDKMAPEKVDLALLGRQLSEYLSAHTSIEDIDQTSSCDIVANGFASLFHICLSLDESAAQNIPNTFIWTFLKKHLFPEQQSNGSHLLPKIILYPDTRSKLYECIYIYLTAHPKLFGSVFEFLNGMVPFYPENDDPYLYELPFQFEQSKALRSPAGYVGLANLSNTCYLNSLLTQLYMNVDFRDYLLSFDVDLEEGSQMLLYETQRLFACLNKSIRRAVEPSAFVSRIKTYEQGPIDITSQMDVDEFYNLLFDRWEAELPDTVSKKTFRSIYGGQLVQQIKSKECNHISERLEPFSAIQCDIQGMSTLEASLQAYVGGETMDGDNKYKCSSCDRHVDAVKRTCLKDVPDNVIFHLKRFDFDLQNLRRNKIDDYFAFPEKLNLHPYTIDSLSSVSPVDKDDMFELVGVLVHSGTAESGHYYSYVRERSLIQGAPARWVEFNDDAVGAWDPAFMEEATFGGPDRRAVYEANGMIFDKSYSAYMLFYQRTSSLTKPSDECYTQRPYGNAPAKIDDDLREHIHIENILLLRRHCLFDPNHAKFTQGCVFKVLALQPSFVGMLESQSASQEETNEASELSALKQLAMETALSHVDQFFSRTKDSREAVHFCHRLSELAGSSQECAKNVFSYFAQRPAVLRSLLQRNPNRDVRAATSNLFVASLEKLSKSSPELYYPSAPAKCAYNMEEGSKVLPQAIELLNYLWKFFQNHIRAWDEYFTTILRVAQLGLKECEHLLAANYLEKCLTIITADESLDLGANYIRMLQNVYRRCATQPTSYMGVLAVIKYLMGVLEPKISHERIVDSADGRAMTESGHFEWTAKEVSLLLDHPESGYPSLFLTRLVGINQAPDITNGILERVMQAGEIPTDRVIGMLERVIQGDAGTEAQEPYIRAASMVVAVCDSIDVAQMVVGHLCRHAAGFRDGEGEAFMQLMRQALNSRREKEEDRRELRLFALKTIPEWAPYMLQYPDSQVREEAEQLVDMCMCTPMGKEAEPGLQMEMSLELALAVGNNCLSYFEQMHVKRLVTIERTLAAVLVRVLSTCNVLIDTSEVASHEVKESFAKRWQKIASKIQSMTVDMVDMVEDEGSEWGGSALSSEPMEEADAEEALALLANSGL